MLNNLSKTEFVPQKSKVQIPRPSNEIEINVRYRFDNPGINDFKVGEVTPVSVGMLGLANDPVFTLIDRLDTNDETRINCLIVKRTSKFYEVENDSVHESFSDAEKCYQFVDTYISASRGSEI